HLEAGPRRSDGPVLLLLPGPANGPGGPRAEGVAGSRSVACVPGRAAPAARSRPIGGPVMQRRPLRDELRDTFEAMSEPAHPALAPRIHEEIWSRPPPAARIPRLAAVIAALVAVVVVAGLVLIGRHALPGQAIPAGRGGLPSPVATVPASTAPGSPAPGVAASPGAARPA